MSAIKTTFTGKVVDVLNMQPKDFDIRDIAHQLALTNRFGGASKVPTNVAQHSVYVAQMVAAQGPEVQMQGLLHDASEAYLGDIIHWLKKSDIFDMYRVVESILEKKIWRHYMAPGFMHPAVEWADNLMCKLEAKYMVGELHDALGKPSVPITLDEEEMITRSVGTWSAWDWDMSEKVFLDLYHELDAKIKA